MTPVGRASRIVQASSLARASIRRVHKPLRLAGEARPVGEANHAVGLKDRNDGVSVRATNGRDRMSEIIHVRTVGAGPHFPPDDRHATNLELAVGRVGADKLELKIAEGDGNEMAVGHGVGHLRPRQWRP
jgi:hypothetical protein